MLKYLLPAALVLLAPSLTPNLSAYDSADLSTYTEMATAYQKNDKHNRNKCDKDDKYYKDDKYDKKSKYDKNDKHDDKYHEKVCCQPGPRGPRGPKGDRGCPGKTAPAHIPTLFASNNAPTIEPGLVLTFAGTPIPISFNTGGYEVSNTDDIVFLAPTAFLLKDPGTYSVEVVLYGALLAGTTFSIRVSDSITQTFTIPAFPFVTAGPVVLNFVFKTFDPDNILTVTLDAGGITLLGPNSASILIERLSKNCGHHHHHHHR